MFLSYLKIAFRNITKRWTFSLISIFGLVIGLTSSILILLWVNHEFSYDDFHENSDQIYRVVTHLEQVNGTLHLATTSAPIAPALKEQYPEVEEYARLYETGQKLIKYKDKKFLEPGFFFADPQFFEIFTFSPVEPNEDPLLPDVNSIVITQKMAEKYFGSEYPIGKILTIEGVGDLRITSIIEHIPQNSHLHFDFIAPFEILRKLNEPLDGWGNFRYYSYIQLNKKANFRIVQAKLKTFLKDNEILIPANPILQPLSSLHFELGYRVDIIQHGNKKNVYIIFSVALLILLIACINYMNLATGYASKRAKEVGLRKVAGAVKFDIIKQCFSESIILTLIAFGISLILAELLIVPYNSLLGAELKLNYFDNNIVLLGLFCLVLLTGIVSGSYPALYISSFSPMRVLKGLFDVGVTKAPLRKTLVVIQFTMSIALIIAAITIYNQLDYIKNKSLGFDSEHVIFVPLRGNMAEKFDILKDDLLKNSEIISVSAANALPHRIGSMTSGISWEGKDPESNPLFSFASVDYDFINTFDMEILEGRNFSKNHKTDIEESFIINEVAVKQLGFDNPVGKQIVFQGTDAKIIGVVKDFNSRSLYNQIEPVFLGILTESYRYFNIFIKTRSENIANVTKYIEATWEKHQSKYPVDYYFVDESINHVYKPILQLREVFIYFASIAILLSCLGLFGLASFMTEQRVKEVGIRKVLGASITGIMLLFSKEFTKWVIISNILAWPIAWIVMNRWLQTFAFRIDISLFVFLFAGGLALFIAILTVGSQAVKAAIANPADSLRYE